MMAAQEYEERSGWLTFAAILITSLTAGLFGCSLWAEGSGICAPPHSPCSGVGRCSVVAVSGARRSVSNRKTKALLDSFCRWFGICVGVVGDRKLRVGRFSVTAASVGIESDG